MGPGYFWWGGMWIFPLIMIVVCIVVLYLIFGRGGFRPPWLDNGKDQGGTSHLETPLAILKKRYARGEITRDEFEQMKIDITDKAS